MGRASSWHIGHKDHQRKTVRQHDSLARLNLVNVLGVGEETTHLGGPTAEAHGDVDPGRVEFGAHGIAALARYDVDININTVGQGKRLAVDQISGLAIDIKPCRRKADSDLGLAHSRRDRVVDRYVRPRRRQNRYDAAAVLSVTSAACQIVVQDAVHRILNFNVPESVLQTLPAIPFTYQYDFIMQDTSNPPVRVVLMQGKVEVKHGITGG
jgi:hypothetical protein